MTVDIVHKQCGYQVLINRPRDVHPPDDSFPLDPCLNCGTVADAWWANLIVTYLSWEVVIDHRLYIDFMFVASLIQKRYGGHIRLPEGDAEPSNDAP